MFILQSPDANRNKKMVDKGQSTEDHDDDEDLKGEETTAKADQTKENNNSCTSSTDNDKSNIATSWKHDTINHTPFFSSFLRFLKDEIRHLKRQDTRAFNE